MIRRTQSLIASAITSFALTGFAVALATPNAATPTRAGSAPSTEALLSIPVQAPEGGDFRLVYRPGHGWHIAARHGEQPVRKTAMSEPAATADPGIGATEDPLSVFVDGPTGFVFVWTSEKPGWTFVGHVGERHH